LGVETKKALRRHKRRLGALLITIPEQSLTRAQVMAMYDQATRDLLEGGAL
jgi:hypothetical protein